MVYPPSHVCLSVHNVLLWESPWQPGRSKKCPNCFHCNACSGQEKTELCFTQRSGDLERAKENNNLKPFNSSTTFWQKSDMFFTVEFVRAPTTYQVFRYTCTESSHSSGNNWWLWLNNRPHSSNDKRVPNPILLAIQIQSQLCPEFL